MPGGEGTGAKGITSAELEWPLRRITVNLAPADLRKEGSGFDLPIALAVLAASRQISAERLAGHAALGSSRSTGASALFPGHSPARRPPATPASTDFSVRPSLPPRSPSPASNRFPCAISRTRAPTFAATKAASVPAAPRPQPPEYPDLADVRGQERARRALEIAAAGRHNLLLGGPPGTGRRCLPGGSAGICPDCRSRRLSR